MNSWEKVLGEGMFTNPLKGSYGMAGLWLSRGYLGAYMSTSRVRSTFVTWCDLRPSIFG